MHPNLGRAVVGGLAGTVVMTMMMYLVSPMMMGMKMDVANMLGSMLGIGWTLGMVMHFMLGTIVFPAVYTFALYSWLPGGPAVKGVVWGATLWLIAQTMVMPMAGAGFFSSAMGGMMAVTGSLVGHLMYGGLLGVIAGEGEPVTATTSPFHA